MLLWWFFLSSSLAYLSGHIQTILVIQIVRQTYSIHTERVCKIQSNHHSGWILLHVLNPCSFNMLKKKLLFLGQAHQIFCFLELSQAHFIVSRGIKMKMKGKLSIFFNDFLFPRFFLTFFNDKCTEGSETNQLSLALHLKKKIIMLCDQYDSLQQFMA